jgi:carbamoyltransferase
VRILGISAFYHDAAAAFVEDGRIVAAAQEERFTRRKHDPRFPTHAIEYCLAEAGATMDQVDHVAFYDKPFLKMERLLETYVAFAPRGFRSFSKAIPVWVKEKLFQKDLIRRELKKAAPDVDWHSRLLFSEHHQSHAASAFFPSPFEEAVVLTMDGVGEWATTSVAIGRGRDLQVTKEIHFPHSLGLLYSAFTFYTGFRVNSGEYKVMGLAPYGNPVYRDRILESLIDLKPDGSFRLDQEFFDYCTGLRMTNRKFDQLFDGPPRKPEAPVTQREMDLAASIQAVTEEVVLRLVNGLAEETKMENLCLAGGVALNCVANGEVLRRGGFKNVWVQPAAGDAGGALGAALAANYGFLGQQRAVDPAIADAMAGSYLGPSYQQDEIEASLKESGAKFEVLSDSELIKNTADSLAAGKAIGWFQGRMEYGPRALGNRSILGDPRSEDMQKSLNLKVKYRESFRPFAPAIRAEDVGDWFELDQPSPYMLFVDQVAKQHCRTLSEGDEARQGLDRLNVPRSDIPAVTHVDFSARIQTVHKETNPRFYDLLTAFNDRTGCPVLVNTSFNVRGEPIVGTPEDAFRCFMGTEIEILSIGNCFLRKEEQDPALKRDYSTAFDLD